MGGKTEKRARKMVRAEISRQVTGKRKQLQAIMRSPWRWFSRDPGQTLWHDCEDFPADQHRYRFRFVDRVETSGGEFNR